MRVTARKQLRNGHGLTSDWLKIKSAFSGTATNVKDKAGAMLSDSVEGIKKKSAKVQNKVQVYTTKKPLKSLGIALLVGVAVGWLLKR